MLSDLTGAHTDDRARLCLILTTGSAKSFEICVS